MEHNLYILSVVIHILSVVVWLGSAAFLVIAALPFFKKIAPDQLLSFFEFSEKRLRIIGWSAFLLLLLTGIYSIHYRFGFSSITQQAFWIDGAGQLLFFKLLLFVVIIGLSFWHDFISGPKTLGIWREFRNGRLECENELSKLRRYASLLGRIIGIIAIAIIVLAVKIVRG